MFDQSAVGVIKHGGEQHDEHIDRLSPRIEDQAGDKQHNIAPSLRKNIVQKQYYRQKHKQKYKAAEYHLI
jgi:hypothetical protein